MALGGSQKVGASCYFLGLGEDNILLDCGIGFKDNLRYNPVLSAVLEMPGIYSLSQISEIYISHAHLDHTGFLPELIKLNHNSKIYMTPVTVTLLESQYNDKNYLDIMHYNKSSLPYAISNLDNVVATVNYMQKIPFKNYTVSFYQAGHIPGAMMTLFEYKNKRILYTGDFSLHETPLTGACQIPNKKIDILIMCGLHAKHPKYLTKTDPFDEFKQKISNNLNYGYNIFCHVPQLSKGVEILTYLNEYLSKEIKIYIDEKIYSVICSFENLNRQILQKNNYRLTDNTVLDGKYIILSTRKRKTLLNENRFMSCDFSLHDSFEETIDFIKKINPRKAVIVHSPGEDNEDIETVEQRLLLDTECNTDFIFPEEQIPYIL